MAIARRGSTEQRRVFDPIGSERPSRKSTKRRSTSAHGWPPVCSRRCRRYLPAPPVLPLPFPPPMRDARRRIVSGGPDGRARLSPCRPVRYANRDVTRRIVIHDFAAHTLAHARTRSRKHRSPHRKWPVRSTRRSTPTASDAHSTRAPTTVSVRAGPRWTPRCGHAAADLGARGEAHRARRSVSEGGREAASHRCRTTCLRDCATALHSMSAGIALARRARSPQGQRQRPRRADERRAARCGGDPSRREMHGMRMGRL
ncbi:hypothetical protein DP61_2939 [Burkholderia pseudomallei]|nr:hypothetical protein DP58_456 [Burkholderia pseudomallei]AIO91515.1 hypothetical protein DP48_2349 [Burkholderia pseudomallei]KGC75645.1 hypothetical protein DP61_2939 [Burkholderia pseudomallei]